MSRLQPFLPVDAVLDRLKEPLAENRPVLLRAEPGAGKTTRVPLALLADPWMQNRRILVLEPRRLAAAACARFMAGQLGEKVGRTVGYRVRYESRVSEQTRIEVVTEGILVRRLQKDPELNGVGLVIFDEFHERHLEADLSLALCLDIRQSLREDLRLLLMSATLEAEPLRRALGEGLDVVDCPGRSHPVTVRYLPGRTRGDVLVRLPGELRRVLAQTAGDVLVFLPGRKEIAAAAEALAGEASTQGLDLVQLHGGLDPARQHLALQPSGRRRVILATNIAETSLTLDGVTVVVDSGLEKRPRFDPGSGLSRLETVRISRSSARQRAGRAGRTGPGTCFRLWSEGEDAELLESAPPEIRVADLAPLLLQLHHWGVEEPRALTWIDAPPPGQLQVAAELLRTLGALDDHGRLTADGRRMAEFPCHPRLARLLIEAGRRGCPALGAALVALLEEGHTGVGEAGPADVGGCDLTAALKRQQTKRTGRFSRAFADWCRRLGCRAELPDAGRREVAELLLAGWPDRVAARIASGQDVYLLAGGRRARLAARSAARGANWLLPFDVSAGQDVGVIHAAASLDEDLVERLRQQVDWQVVVTWNRQSERVETWQVRRLGAVELARRSHPGDPDQVAAVLLDQVRRHGLRWLGWDKRCAGLCARVELIRAHEPEGGWPVMTEEGLLAELETWLQPALSGVRDRDAASRIDLLPWLLGRLSDSQQRRLDQVLPARITIPSGRSVAIDYLGAEPVLAAKLQELFGLTQTPRLLNGRVPLLVHLLSPAGRPLQVTRDLASFWRTGYPEVRREMRGRYPKHPWPEDPLKAEATAATKPARAR
ncbi:MAG: ATP-dependent helicase HrpB [Alphaproteobacteria bacterium]|nr:MAG: ATP-dependent helicase HrpB [Alphaproteobacteria bacterium]